MLEHFLWGHRGKPRKDLDALVSAPCNVQLNLLRVYHNFNLGKSLGHSRTSLRKASHPAIVVVLPFQSCMSLRLTHSLLATTSRGMGWTMLGNRSDQVNIFQADPELFLYQ